MRNIFSGQGDLGSLMKSQISIGIYAMQSSARFPCNMGGVRIFCCVSYRIAS